MSTSAPSDGRSASGYAPFAQLIKMLLPSARSIAVYDPAAELVWCSDGYERPDLRAMVDHRRASDTAASRGSVETTSTGIPVFYAALRGAGAQPLGWLVIELGGGNSRSTPSMVVSMLRPVLDCLESKLDLERSTLAADRSAGLELLLRAEQPAHTESSALQDLLNHCARDLNCLTGALLVPDKNLELTWTADASPAAAQLLDRTQKHLLAWARLNNRPMVVNRPGAGTYKILSSPLRDPRGGVLGLVALFRPGDAEDFEPRDVRILEFVGRKAVAILESEYDALTGLPNRLVFERRAQRALDRAATAVLYADLDELEAINQTFGLSAGDEVIQRVGALIQRATGTDALVSRLAGDRFAVALPEGTAAQASEIAASIVSAVGQLGYLNGSEAVQVSVSIGTAVAPAGERLRHVLAVAELACKRAKAGGGARVAAIDDLSTLATAEARQAIAAAELRDALASNHFELDAQPIVRLGTRAAVTGYELLVRLRNARGELVAPNKFLEACAQYGLLPALDRWVLCAAVDALRPHSASIAAVPIFFAINVSAPSLQSRRYAAFALETLAAAGLPARLFCFELKESAAVADPAAADALIRDLSEAGAKVALDDFGSGLSSIAHLKQLPVGYLKIDGAFVRRIGTDRIAESIVSGLARAARLLGVPTIAEHVETPAIAERLRELDVTFGQGFHFARPQPFAEIVRRALAAPAAPAAPQAKTGA